MPVAEDGPVYQDEVIGEQITSNDETAVPETIAEDKTSLSNSSEEENAETQERNEASPLPCKLYVGGLDENATEEKIRAVLDPFGEIVECHLKGDNARTKYFAFVTYASPDSVQAVLEEQSNGPFYLDDRPIDLRLATPRNHGNRGRPILRQKNKLFIGGLSAETTEEDLLGHFTQYGAVQEAELKYDKVTNRHRGFGFVTFETCVAAQEACRKSYQEIRGKKVEIKEALPPELLGTSKTKKITFASGYHGYQSVLPPYAVYPWSPYVNQMYSGNPYHLQHGSGQRAGSGQHVPLLQGYQYYGPGVPQTSASGGDYGNSNGKDHVHSPNSVDYVADQFQGMNFGPHQMYPMVPVTMAMDHPIQGYPMHHNGMGQYPGGGRRMYPHYSTGHAPSLPTPGHRHLANPSPVMVN